MKKGHEDILGLAALSIGVASFAFLGWSSRSFSIAPPPNQAPSEEPPPKITHLLTPEPLKAIYMTGYVAGDEAWREKLVSLVEETELNSVVIDLKDYTGRISFLAKSFELISVGAAEERVKDLPEFVKTLHDKDIYVIGRISVFQDPFLAAKRPDLAVKKMSEPEKLWRDYKGLTWIDAGATPVWRYIAVLAKEAYAMGFDEINLDYIRFPSDGNMRDIVYPWSGSRLKTEILAEFFEFFDREMSGTGAVLSADLFGMTTTNNDDLNVGQVLEAVLPHFDYVAPMVYPSHYPAGFLGFDNPAAKPYEVVKYSMDQAVRRASTTPWKLRPWLQDFNLGASYTPEMVRREIQAVYDSGLTSWMLWNASNRYTRAALE